jgi:hypothetical protein
MMDERTARLYEEFARITLKEPELRAHLLAYPWTPREREIVDRALESYEWDREEDRLLWRSLGLEDGKNA